MKSKHIAGLMGAYGAALHAKEKRALEAGESSVLSLEALEAFQRATNASNYPQAQSFANKSHIFFAHKSKLGK